MARTGRKHLLGHLFASVKSKQEGLNLEDDAAKADFIAASRMSVQQSVADDPSKRKVVRCPRRAGKSWLVLSIGIEGCLRKRSSIWLIVGLSRPTIQQIFWGLLKQLSSQLELGIQFLETPLIAKFPNGSQILFRGAETRSEIEKLRGGQYDGAIVDECKSFSPVVFKELIEDVIEPALGDRRGVLILVGTPGDILAGPFYDATCEPAARFVGGDGIERESNHLYGTPEPMPYVWSLHTWTLQDNTECPWLWEEALKTKALRGWSDDHPSWRREYLGHWVVSKNRLVYRYIPRKHDYEDLHEDKWVYVLGLDIGYKDADAIVVWAYSRTAYDVWQVYGEKRVKQNITQLAGWIYEVRDSYCGTGPEIMVYDPAGGGSKIIAELAQIHGLYFDKPADKRDKNDFIELMNTEFDLGRLHILPDQGGETGGVGQLARELMVNRWLERTLGTAKRLEDPKTPNDLCDAALYGWRECDHRRPQPPDRKPVHDSKEWWDERKATELAAVLKLHKARKAPQDDFTNMDNNWWTPTAGDAFN
jgi:hypothetical protein